MINIKAQDTYLAFWFVSFPYEAKLDIMGGAIWRDGGTGECLGRYKFRHYDPENPGHLLSSGEKHREWHDLRFDSKPDLREIKKLVSIVANRLGGHLEWTNQERSGNEMKAYLMTGHGHI